MTTDALIAELNHLVLESSEDYAQLDRLAELVARLPENHDGALACAAMLHVVERHPHVAFGTPGPLVHTLESYRGQYEALLLASLDRQPTTTTIWMLNRLLNAATGTEKNRLLHVMHRLQTHPRAEAEAQAEAAGFFRFQTTKA